MQLVCRQGDADDCQAVDGVALAKFGREGKSGWQRELAGTSR
ncbi:MAG: hypothetical protein ACKO81_14670 [Planctomycetota bacterium]